MILFRQIVMHRLMFYGAKPYLFERARDLRENMTNAERKLWQHLRKNQLGVRFKPQHPAGGFILDFYCHALMLAIEVDGNIHLIQNEYDQSRTDELEKFGIKLIRFTNKEIENEIEEVLLKIKKTINEIRNNHSNV